MTVLAKYQRLEAEAIWRPDPDDQRRDVIVSIGDATLTISAPSGAVLSHWSLPAILRLNPGKTPAVYAPGETAPERLELSDAEMTAAIEAVLKAVRGGGSRPGRVRAVAVGGVALLLIAFGMMWAPGAIIRYTASLVPDGARSEIGTRLRSEIRRLAGAPCSAPAGLRALERLQTRLFPEGNTKLAILPSALAETAHLPGGTILVGHRLVEDHETPEVVSGFVLAEDLRRAARDPLERLLADAGVRAALGLLTTGRLDDDALRRHAEGLIALAPVPVSDRDLLLRFGTAGISGQPYAYAKDFSGQSTLPLIEASEIGTSTTPILEDGDWIALQRICEG